MKQKSKQSARTLVIRLLCVLLCVLVTAGVLAGCRKKPDNGKPSGTTAAPANDSDAASDTEPADGRDDLDDSYHFDRDFRILSRKSTVDEFESSSSIGANTVSNAVFSRNALVEKRADVTIKVIPFDGDWEGAKDGDSRGGNKEFEGRVRNDANADKSEYDLIATHSAYLANLAVDGLGMDLTQLEDINLTKRWWNEAYYNECNFNGSIYMMVGDLAHTLYGYLEVVFFNETLANDYSLGDLYDVALEGNWTYALLKEYVAKVTVDLDATEDTRKYGLLSNCHAERAFVNAVEANYLVKQEDGTRLYPDSLNETAEKRLSDFVKFIRDGRDVTGNIHEDKNSWGDDKKAQTPIFFNGRALFYMQTLDAAKTLKDNMSDSYGVLPFPKWDDTQIEYHTSTMDSLTSVMIPKKVADPKSAGVVTELLAMYGNQIVTPAYYETVLTYQSFNNAKCIEMLEMIRVSANISFQQVFTNCLGNPNSLVPVAIRETREISNIYASDHTKWDIAKLYKDLEAIKKN